MPTKHDSFLKWQKNLQQEVAYHPGKHVRCWGHTLHTSRERCSCAVHQPVGVCGHRQWHAGFSRWLRPECQLWQPQSRACHETGRGKHSWNRRQRSSVHYRGWIPAGQHPASVQTANDDNNITELLLKYIHIVRKLEHIHTCACIHDLLIMNKTA